MLGDQTNSPYYPFWPYYGYFDMGPLQLPPLPHTIGMVDSVTKVIYYLTWSQASNHLILSTTIPGPIFGVFIPIYKPGDGPILDETGWYLSVANGHLVITIPDSVQGRAAGSPVWAVDATQAQQVARVSLLESSLTGGGTFGTGPHLQFTPVNTK